jgi:hypothetical protein
MWVEFVQVIRPTFVMTSYGTSHHGTSRPFQRRKGRGRYSTGTYTGRMPQMPAKNQGQNVALYETSRTYSEAAHEKITKHTDNFLLSR